MAMKFSRASNGENATLIQFCGVKGTMKANSALTIGANVNGSVLIPGDGLGTDFAGVLSDDFDFDATGTTISTGTVKYRQVVIQPDAIYKVDVDMSVANAIAVSAASSTSVTIAAGDDDMDGGWGFIRDGKGKGQLFYIAAASTTVYTVPTGSTFLTTPDTTSKLVLLRRHWRHPADSGIDLDSNNQKIKNTQSATGAFLCLEQYLQSGSSPFRPLRPAEDNLASTMDETQVILYAELLPLDHLLRGASTMP